MGSTVANGRATIWIEKTVAARAFANISGQSKDKVGVSSMYTSALAQQSTGGDTIVGRAVAIGISSAKYSSGGGQYVE